MAHTFFGGVFPATRKSNTRRKPLSKLTRPPLEVVIPLLMSADGPSVPVVRPGEMVSVRQGGWGRHGPRQRVRTGGRH